MTDALAAGVNPAAVAAPVNHVDLTMISKHYNHLAEGGEDILRRAAEDAARGIRHFVAGVAGASRKASR